MKRPAPVVRFRLRPEHLDLVAASLAPVDVAIEAYRRWHDAVALTDADAGSYRLIPLLQHNLAGSGALSDTDAKRYARMARFTWVKSQLILDRAAKAIGVLTTAGVPALSIKGAAVLHHSGLGAELRPMDDADVAVHTGRALDALVALHEAGFHSDEVRLDDRNRIAGLVAGHHGLNLRDASGVQVDLHWHALPQSLHPTGDRAMWDRSHDGMPSREDTFVQVLAHATRWSWAPSVQWIADAALLARDGLDWELVVHELGRHRLGVPCADALSVLAATQLAEVPDSVVPRLRRAPLPERFEGRVRRDPAGTWRPSTRLERAADAFGDHVRRIVPPGDRAGVSAARSFLRERWAIPGGGPLIRHALFVGVGRPWTAPPAVRRALAAAPEPGRASGQRRSKAGLGEVLTFTLGGNGLPMLGDGWSFAEEHGTWTIGTEAAVSVPVPADASAGPLLMRMRIVPLLTERVASRRIDVVVDGELVASWDFLGDDWVDESRDVPIPVGPVRAEDARVRFIVHRPVSPQSIDHDVGTRQLGLSLHSITIEAASSHPGTDR